MVYVLRHGGRGQFSETGWRLHSPQMRILAASWLHYSIHPKTSRINKRTFTPIELPAEFVPSEIYPVTRLSFNFRQPKKDKVVQKILSTDLKWETDFIIWPETSNNSVSKHPGNGSQLQPEELVHILVGLKTKNKAIVYIQRKRAPKISKKELKEPSIVIIDVIGDLLSHRASKDRAGCKSS